ncbi:DHA2 family methylenomycin A resistance protein-like MFS transporter [Amycolatopsis lexingtonensis]|uniref:DHA2 family methylenomycin A resistance protein-like MFS transporter n=1 Tax=Amycolatopsis lexingtonensis TaxID=218822 RepID=A0ABR9I005_9PSEU|nr:MFS transporter [Amycolatopsis lexingtonensis]MBE1496515.1 DHA2 family methylenomycin A resistance protein-like MFS transporter [Amycolatopsis lexingtonensis]
MLLFTMCAGMFLVQLDVTVVNVALPTLGTGLHADLAAQQWVVDGYTVVLAAFLLTGGALGDVFGHRRVVLTGFGLFGVASAACGLAATAPVLVAARAGQGLGAALLLPGTLAVITNAYPGRAERARALGVWAGVSALALAAGPVLGGAVVSAAGWRPVFWLNVPIVLAAAFATWRLVPRGTRAPGRRVDVAGVVTAAPALGAGVYAVIGGSAVAAVVAIAALAAFVAVERRTADPMLPLDVAGRTLSANFVSAAMNFVGIGAILVLTLYLQGVRHASPLAAGLEVLPLFGPLSVLAPIAGRLTGRFGPRPLMVAGLALGVLGMLNLVRLKETSGYADLLPTLLGLGVGMGLLTTAVVTAAVSGLPPGRAGVASGVNNTARQAGGALGVAVLGTVAGAPGAGFLPGLREAGVIAAALWLVAIGVTLAGVRVVSV